MKTTYNTIIAQVTLFALCLGTAFDKTFRPLTSHLALDEIDAPAPILNTTDIVTLVTNETAAYERVVGGPSYAEALAFAGNAVNLEIVYSQDIDGFRPNFIKGMEPGSAWFTQKMNNFEEEDSIYLDSEQDSRSDDKEEIDSTRNRNKKYYIWHGHHSTKKIVYGPHSPGAVIHRLGKECGPISCGSSHKFSVSTFRPGSDGPCATKRVHGHLVITPYGSYLRENRKYYIRGVEVISHVRAKYSKKLTGDCVYYHGYCTCSSSGTTKIFKGGQYFGINRLRRHKHGGPTSSGLLVANVKFYADHPDTCNTILKAVEAIAGAGGPIASIGSDFFGQFANRAVCQNSHPNMFI